MSFFSSFLGDTTLATGYLGYVLVLGRDVGSFLLSTKTTCFLTGAVVAVVDVKLGFFILKVT